MRPTQIYQFTIPAGGSFPLQVAGSFFKILSQTGAVGVTGDTFGTIGELLAGQGLREVDFQRLTFRDTTGAANLVRVLVADANFVDDRITGEVSVIDGSRAITMSGRAFMAAVFNTSAAAAGTYPHAQVFNPAGSTKNLIFKSIEGTLNGTTGPLDFMLTQTQIAAATGGANVVSKKAGGPVTVAVPAMENRAALLAATNSYVGFPLANVPVLFKPNEPIIVTPGWGLVVRCSTPATWLGANFDFYEEPT